MSTIASPRDPGGPFPRRANSSIITPTSSTRPSLDITPSGSPNPAAASTSSAAVNPTAAAAANPHSKRARAALREYYHLRAATATTAATPSSSSSSSSHQLPPPTVQITDLLDPAAGPSLSLSPFPHGGPSAQQQQQQQPSELDDPAFDADAYTARLLREGSLADLLRAYTRALTEMRALDAERKALVYDNYSKLIAATETIRRMRGAASSASSAAAAAAAAAGGTGLATEGSEEGGLVAGGAAALDAVVERIYAQARALREGLREKLGGEAGGAAASAAAGEGPRDARARTRELAREVVQVPERLRRLVAEGKEEEAQREWELPRRLLVRWRELGVGGDDVEKLIEEGDAALGRTGEEERKENGGRAERGSGEQEGGE
ncbi:hypothetical protein VTJ83DRAFT_3206 [Remersonia thermophila]|uniref:Vacuolar protein sorting-associated protein 51 homolog n=1 Tax=Remersonia thermophila TaxID=72144 RepID=A0ABR4DDF9_9PEZI